MVIRTRLSWASLASLALCCATPAGLHAAPAAEEEVATFNALDVNEDGRLSGTEMTTVAAFDADQNGRVTLEEFREGRARLRGVDPVAEDEKLFAELDLTEDGWLSGKEMRGHESFDTNGDEEITKAEFLAGRAAQRKVNPTQFNALAQQQFLARDITEDGVLSGTEKRGVEHYDANQDGRITSQEYLAGLTRDRQNAPDGESPNTPAPPQATVDGDRAFQGFLATLTAGEARPLLDQMGPELQTQLDEPLLQFLLDTIAARLGAPAEKAIEIDTQQREVAGVPTTVSRATVAFDKGDAQVEVVYQKGLIVGFNVASDELTDMHGLLADALLNHREYATAFGKYMAPRGETFLKLALDGEDERAYAMFHPEVRKQLPFDAVQTQFAAVRAKFGELQSIEFDGFTTVLDDNAKLKKITLNYLLEFDKGAAQGHVQTQVVGYQAVLVGFDLERSQDPSRVEEGEIETQTYHNQLDKLGASHAAHFVDFRFDYPEGWAQDSKAGVDKSPNMVKVFRNAPLPDGRTFTQENFAVGSCQVRGAGEAAQAGLELLSEQFQESVAQGFPKYKLNRAGKMRLGAYAGYGFDFSSKLPHPVKGEVDCWGRVILLAPAVIGQEHGLSIIMLATSEAPEIKGLEDLGVKGELPVILQSFQVAK